MREEEKPETIFITNENVQINNEIMDNVFYAYYKKGAKDPIVSALGKVIKDKYGVETHRDFINVYDAFEGGRLYIVKEVIDGEDDPIVYKQIAPTIRDSSFDNDIALNDDLFEQQQENEKILVARNKQDYLNKVTEIQKFENETIKAMLDKANELNRNYLDEINRLKIENFELKVKLDNEIWKNQFIKEKELEIEKQTEKELSKYQQTLNDNNTTSIIASLVDKVAPILIDKFLNKNSNGSNNANANQNYVNPANVIPNVPIINENDISKQNNGVNYDVSQ